ncbi:ParB/RepB/Spo0J family partition protein [Mangrovicoccus algicola]|uniref:ParB N-terminal domain-containing protein n=1 Tax=Mangrovicoccus algicola TaxID=2771008 RepID=A0A8J6Z6I5_9RHOB|nr:ParB/RepB/Spo0J family partition protein [Mangrovicoccus algicola]MBE3637340.1 ParB N-terminal domain-containing protein [Mangrovicoccus algicola]
MKHEAFDITHFPIARLHVAPENPRSDDTVDPVLVDQLADSIAENGVLVPLIAYEHEGQALAVSGGRRARALHKLVDTGVFDGGHMVPVRLVPQDQARDMGATEQITQQRLSDRDELMVYNSPAFRSMSDGEIARRLGKSVTAVKQRRAVHQLPEDVLTLVLDGSLSIDQGYGLTYFHEDEDAMREMVSVCMSRPGMDLNDIRDAFKRSRADWSKSAKAALTTKEAYLAAGGRLQEDLFADTSFILTPSVLDSLAHIAGEERIEADYPDAAFIRYCDDLYGSASPQMHPGVDRLTDDERAEWAEIRWDRYRHDEEAEPEWFARYSELSERAEKFHPPELVELLGVCWTFGFSADKPLNVRENCLPDDLEPLYQGGWLMRPEPVSDMLQEGNEAENVKLPAKVAQQIGEIRVHCLRMLLAKKPDRVLAMFAEQLANPSFSYSQTLFHRDDRDIVSADGVQEYVRQSPDWVKIASIDATKESVDSTTPSNHRKILAKQLLDRLSLASVNRLPEAQEALLSFAQFTEDFFEGYKKPHLIEMIQAHVPADKLADVSLDKLPKKQLAIRACEACENGKVFLPLGF